MVKRSEELYESATAIANAGGVAEARLTPLRAFEDWKISGSTVQSTSTAETEARLYRGTVSPSNAIGGTRSGNFDTGSGEETIRNGIPLICQWTGATPGATCTVVISGERLIG